MIKVLITDDNIKRTNLIVSTLKNTNLSNLVQITTCSSADRARIEMLDHIDILILDILLPKKDAGTPHSSNSIKLLKDICDPTKNYIRPKIIIGLTADISSLASYQDEFIQYATTVLNGSAESNVWLATLFKTIESYVASDRKTHALHKDSLLITVHGIRTYGKWQEDLKRAIDSYSKTFESIDIKYGFFDLVSFIIPNLRERKAKKISFRLKNILEQHQDKDIHIICHSFGSLIVSKAIQDYTGRKLRTIILCGSPLSHNQNIDHLVSNSHLTVNECGTRDYILVLARTLLLGLGDAGRIGFTREHSSVFINRYFIGGHSLYFDNSDTPFWTQHWIPILTLSSAPERVDERKNYIGEDLVDITIKILTLLKPITYIAIALFLLWGFTYSPQELASY